MMRHIDSKKTGIILLLSIIAICGLSYYWWFHKRYYINEDILGLLALLLISTQQIALLTITFVILLVGAVGGAFEYIYGTPYPDLWATLMNTTGTEVWGFFRSFDYSVLWFTLAMTILSIIYFWSGKRWIQQHQKPEIPNQTRWQWLKTHKWLIACLILFEIVIQYSWITKDLLKLYTTYSEYQFANKVLSENKNWKDDWHIQPNSNYHRYQNYVLVIGESARADYASAFGYPLDTTPFLNQAKGIFFTHTYSASFATIPSLTRSLYNVSPDGYTYQWANNIMTLANKADYNTFWISNQGHTGPFVNGISIAANRAHHTQYMQLIYHRNIVDDNFLLKYLEKALNTPSKEPRLIVLHMMGSHPYTCDRLYDFPVKWHVSSHEVDCYVATIGKLDQFISTAVKDLAQHGTWSLLYLSDHGLRVDPKEVTHDRTLINAYHVPFFILSSDASQHDIYARTYSNYHFLSFFGQWLGVNTQEVDPTHSNRLINLIPRIPQIDQRYNPYDATHIPDDTQGLKVFDGSVYLNPQTLQKNPPIH